MYNPQKNLPFKNVESIDFPRVVQLQTVSMCNGKCIMCPYSRTASFMPHGKMEPKLFERVVDECSEYGLEEFKPFLMNEPLLDDRLPLLLKYARSRLKKTKMGFSTNASMLYGKMALELAQVELDELWFNFSGNSENVYNKVMVGLDYHTVKNNIIRHSEIIKTMGSKTKLNISMVEIQDSLPEIEDSIGFWSNYGIAVHPIPYNNRGGNSNELGIKVLTHPIGKRICDKPTNKLCILYNGDVVLCPTDWEKKFIIGNVQKQSIWEIWHSEARHYYIDKILRCESDSIKLCKECDFPLLYGD